MIYLDSEELWAVLWALAHLAGLIVMLMLRGRSARQLLVAEHWRAHAGAADRPEADELVILTKDRHRRNNALTVAAGLYFGLGLLVLSVTVSPWLDPSLYRLVSRAILTGGEAIWIGSAWMSVLVGDRLARQRVLVGRP